MKKFCSGCGKVKPFDSFYRDKHKQDGYTSRCMECFKEYSIENKENKKIYYENNIDKIKEQKRIWYVENREKELKRANLYYQNHSEKMRAYNKLWKINNSNRVRERARIYRKNNPIKLREQYKRYRNKHPEIDLTHQHKRRALMLGTVVGNINLLQVYKNSSWVCGICGKKINKKLKYPNPKSKSIDHIVPLTREGTHTYDNIQLAHLVCNILKSNNINNLQLKLCFT